MLYVSVRNEVTKHGHFHNNILLWEAKLVLSYMSSGEALTQIWNQKLTSYTTSVLVGYIQDV